MDSRHIERAQPGERAASLSSFREHALARGVNPALYWTLRAILVPFFLLYFRLQRTGHEHLPRTGPLLLASNHRSFLDPFVIGTLVRRPVYYMAKRELFEKRWQALLLNALGAFPVDRGAGDQDAMSTARAILERGDCVVVFPEGTRVRPGRSAHRDVASGVWRWKPVRRWLPSRSSAAKLCAEAGASDRARSASASADRCSSLRSRTARPRSPPGSPSASGRVSACSGTGWAASRHLALYSSMRLHGARYRAPPEWAGGSSRARG